MLPLVSAAVEENVGALFTYFDIPEGEGRKAVPPDRPEAEDQAVAQLDGSELVPGLG